MSALLLALTVCAAGLLGQTTQTPDSGYVPALLQQGRPDNAYALTNLYSMNYFTGRLSVSIPLKTVEGRGEVKIPIAAVFQNNLTIQHSFGPSIHCPGQSCDLYSLSGYRGDLNLSAGSLALKQADTLVWNAVTNGYTTSRLYFYRTDGSSTELVDIQYYGQPVLSQCHTELNYCPTPPVIRGSNFVSTDGSQIRFLSDQPIQDQITWSGRSPIGSAAISGFLVFRDGTKYRVQGNFVTTIWDRNGKVVNFPQSWNPQTVVDSLGRTTTLTNSGFSSDLRATETLSFPGVNQANRAITVTWGPLGEALRPGYGLQTWQTLFPLLNDVDTNAIYQPSVIKTITLADNSSQFQFQYNSYGDLSAMTLPTGGRYEFDWQGMFGNDPSGENLSSLTVNRRVVEIREYPDGSSTSVHTQHIDYDPNASRAPYSTGITYATVSDFDRGRLITQVKHSYYSLDQGIIPVGHAAWKSGREYLTETFSPTGTLLRSVATNWQQKGNVPWPDQTNPYFGDANTQPSFDPRIASVTTTLEDGSVTQVSYGYDQFNNETDRWEYDYGAGAPGALLRRTQTAYLGTAKSAYSDPSVNLVSVPASRTTFNGAGAMMAQTIWQYDEGSVQPASGITGHDDANYGITSNLRANVTSQYRWLNTTNSYLGTLYAYDVAGNVLSKTDPSGRNTTFAYNDDGQNRYAFPTTTTNALGQSTKASYDYGIGKATLATDSNGVNTTFAYNDPFDRLTAVQRAAGWTKDIHTRYVYFSPTQVGKFTSQVAGRELRTDTLFDGFGRPQKTQVYEDASHYIETTQSYDALGRVAAMTNPSRPGDNLAYPTTNTYDAVGRLVAVTVQDGSSINTTYSGSTVTTTDQAGVARKNTYDALGRLLRVQEDPNGANIQTAYQYDALDNLVGVNQAGQLRSFTYDSLSRLQQATNPESGRTIYAYDAVGNLQMKTDARNVTATYSYDALDRLIRKSYSDGTSPVNYVYDRKPDGTALAYALGRLVQVSNSASVTNITGYDPIGEITGSQQITGGQTYNFQYDYNFSGALISETYPSGRVVTSGYDGANRPAYVGGSWAGATTNYIGNPNFWTGYWPHGGIHYYGQGNNIMHAISFNPRLQQTESYDAIANDPSHTLFVSCPNWGSSENPGVYDMCPHPARTPNNGNLVGYDEYHGRPGYPHF